MASQWRSSRQQRRCLSLITAVVMISLIVSCETVQPISTARPKSYQAATDTPTAAAPDPFMVLVSAGAYTIGSNAAEDAQPVHQVSLNAFRIDRYEVTNAQYAEFLNSLYRPLQNAAAGAVRSLNLPVAAIPLLIEGAEGSQQNLLIALDDEHSRIAIQDQQFISQAGYENHPVTETTWSGSQQFCSWRRARLPTEVEWEAAARRLAGRTYPWGNQPPTIKRAVYGRSSGETAPIGTHPTGATPDGIHDLAGNVAEWTSTLYRPYPYSANDGREQPDAAGE